MTVYELIARLSQHPDPNYQVKIRVLKTVGGETVDMKVSLRFVVTGTGDICCEQHNFIPEKI